MNTARPEAPEMLALKFQLSIDTHVDQRKFKDWVDANENWIGQSLALHGVTTAAHPDHHHEIYAFARLEYKRFTTARTSKPEQAPPVPAAMTTATQPSTQPASAGPLFSRLFRRRAP